MSSLAIIPDRNTAGKVDYTGAFLPEARLWIEKYGGALVQVTIGVQRGRQADQVLTRIATVQPDVVAFFCHGFRNRLQFGFALDNVSRLAKAIAANASAPNVVIYACSTGAGVDDEGEGGFADTLRDELCLAGAKECRVWAHTRAGHSTQCPYVRLFTGPQPASGGTWVVEPGSALWWPWRRYLQGPGRFEFPFFTVDEIHTLLRRIVAETSPEIPSAKK